MKSCALFFRATVAWDVVRDKLSPPGSLHHSFIICRRRSVLIRLGNSLFILISCFQTTYSPTYTHLLTFILDLDLEQTRHASQKAMFPVTTTGCILLVYVNHFPFYLFADIYRRN